VLTLPPALVLTIFLGISLLASLASKRTGVPYTIFLVFLGIAVAASAQTALAPIFSPFTTLVSGSVFVGLILPPLLFESTMSIRTEEFRAVSGAALLLATGGVAIATMVVGIILWRFVGLTEYTAFLFAALIAPTDVATVLEVFRRTNVPPRLSTLLETESIFNDPTAITLLTVILTGIEVSRLSFLNAATSFLQIFGGGIVVGLAVAWGARQLQKAVHDSMSQIILTMAAVYGSYGIATSAGVSGLIAVAITGLFYGNTVLFKIEERDVERVTRNFWSVLAFFANTIAFLFIGLSTDIFTLANSLGIILVAFGIVMLARLVSAYPILSIPRIAASHISWSWKHVAMLGGMRGALSIALVASLPNTVPGYSTIVAMTFGVVILSILVQGPFLTAYVKRAFRQQSTLEETMPHQEAPGRGPGEEPNGPGGDGEETAVRVEP
jgi:monovalent cation:H+ antiporter, CPA1 family